LVEGYSLSMQKMLNMPKLGLNRYYQERMSQALDKLNMFTAVASEFSLQMLQPVESSMAKMQQKIKDMAEGDGYFEDAKEYYSMWIKILEGDYMTLLQSPEFITKFHDVVNTYMEFYAIYEEVMQDGLQFLPVTTKKDMDAVYKENYLLKKQVKAMSRRMEDLEKKVEQLEASAKK
jgi:class III poly(R)-hydroxyalkanoic acid synthase PhaE subunit